MGCFGSGTGLSVDNQTPAGDQGLAGFAKAAKWPESRGIQPPEKENSLHRFYHARRVPKAVSGGVVHRAVGAVAGRCEPPAKQQKSGDIEQ